VSVVTLKSSEQLAVRIEEPPLLDYARKTPGSELLDWCWPQIKEEMLGGQMRRWLHAPYALGELNGELVGSIAYYAAADRRDVGVVEFVQTAAAHRGKGISSALLGTLIERFIGEGGLALYLCTTNPIAGSLYEKHGFKYLVGDGMRYLAPGVTEFDETYLSFNGDATVRDATWADLARLTVLYNHAAPGWLVKDYLTNAFQHSRYESHFVKLMRRIEDRRGASLVLESPARRVVGAAVFERLDNYFEQHRATLSLRVCPAYLHQTPELLDVAASRAREIGISMLQVHAAGRDSDQREILTASGFSEEARFRDRLRDGDDWTDLVLYTIHLADGVAPIRAEGEYYGARQAWQTDRVLTPSPRGRELR